MKPDLNHTAVTAYGLADGMYCEECGRARINRLLYQATGGCATCDEVITRHRCMKRPGIETLALGESWECPDCGSVWTVIEDHVVTCGECGRSEAAPGWSVVTGDRMDTAPRHKPVAYTPMRNRLPGAARPLWGPYRDPPRVSGACYTLPGGGAVHIRPGCRCP